MPKVEVCCIYCGNPIDKDDEEADAQEEICSNPSCWIERGREMAADDRTDRNRDES